MKSKVQKGSGIRGFIAITGFLVLQLLSQIGFAQVYSNKPAPRKQSDLIDSISKTEYPYILPILGAGATKKGFELPYSAGISMQYFQQVSDLIIENLRVGFNGDTMYNIDNIVQFDKAVATAGAITIRPDVWLFPFLNVYGILGIAKASTDVGFGVYVQDSTGTRINIMNAGSTIEFTTNTFGIGMTPTIGVAGFFLALDMNVAWTDVPQLTKPAKSFVFGPRFGKSIRLKKPGSSFAMWAGGFRVQISSGTDGSIPFSEALDINGMQAKVDNASVKIEETQTGVDTWWAGLTPVEQKNPVNIAKYSTANRTLEAAGNLVSAMDGAVNKVGGSTVQYAMDKRPKDMWNFIIGSQYQFNKHWMIRGEYGFLGSRSQFLIGTQYRFGL